MFRMILLLPFFMWCVIGKPNFLFIVVDDLRPSLDCYGDVNAYTPNINRLAKESIIFTRAYAQQALCAPSRNSFLTSRRPDTLKLYDFYSYWRNDAGNYTTLPQHLKENGYITMSIGKVFHPGVSSNNSDDEPYSWSEKPFHPYTNRYRNAAVCRTSFNSRPATNLVCPVHIAHMPHKTLPDIETLFEAQHFIQKHKTDSRSFFLAVGFHKPHIPLKYPKMYKKYHPLEKYHVPHPYKWNNISSIAYNPWTDLRERDDVQALHLKFPWEKIPETFGSSIIQSYYAAVSYIDDLIGKLIHELKVAGIKDDTVIILTSDHGWSLGEHAEWAKYSNFDVSVRVPLIISVPEVTYKQRPVQKICRFTRSLVELVDIFPTIADIAGIPIPMCPRSHTNDTCSEGISLLPLINAAQRCENIRWKKAAFSQYPRPSIEPSLKPNSDKPRMKDIHMMGYTLISDEYRYTAWVPFSHLTKEPNWDIIIAEELYDYRVDAPENFNIADSESLSKVKDNLRKLLKSGWRAALPNDATDVDHRLLI